MSPDKRCQRETGQNLLKKKKVPCSDSWLRELVAYFTRRWLVRMTIIDNVINQESCQSFKILTPKYEFNLSAQFVGMLFA